MIAKAKFRVVKLILLTNILPLFPNLLQSKRGELLWLKPCANRWPRCSWKRRFLTQYAHHQPADHGSRVHLSSSWSRLQVIPRIPFICFGNNPVFIRAVRAKVYWLLKPLWNQQKEKASQQKPARTARFVSRFFSTKYSSALFHDGGEGYFSFVG